MSDKKTYQRRDYVAAVMFSFTTAVRLAIGLIVVKVIANVGGPEGFGLIGQFMSILAMVSVFSGGGISTGLTKYIAERQSQGNSLAPYIQTALAITLSSGILFGCLLLGVSWGAHLLFGSDKFSSIIIMTAVFQMFIGINNFSLAIINGLRDVIAFSVSTILGSILGVFILYLATKKGGIDNAMFGLLCFSTVTVFFSPVLLWFRHKQLRIALIPRFNTKVTSKLIKFSGLQLFSAFTLPLAHIAIRSIAENTYGWSVVGYWQGVNKISDAYLQFFLVFLANYFLPRLAEADKFEELRKLVFGLLKIMIPICVVITIGIFVARNFVIKMLFSSEFSNMEEYFAFQLVGDVLKISTYTFVYVAISRALLKVCVIAEIFQASLLILFSWVCSLYFGSVGLVFGYALTYFVYFICALFLFLYWSRGNKRHSEVAI